MSASANATITVVSNSATSVTLTVVPNLTGPVPANTGVANIQVAPSNWSGTLALSGTNASSFAIAGPGSVGGVNYAGFIVTGNAALPVGSYAVTVTATP